MFPAISLPADALVVLIGIAASGKSTFAARWFRPTAVLSSDQMRAIITDSPSAQGATDDAFDLLHRVLEMRLRRGRLTVIDATNVEDWARAQLLNIARRYRRPAVAMVLDVPLGVALERNAARGLVNDLSRKLEQWTGRRWTVIVSNEAGQPTLRSQNEQARNEHARAAEADPRVQEVLARFPGTKVVEVRRLAAEPPESNIIAEDLNESSDGDDD